MTAVTDTSIKTDSRTHVGTREAARYLGREYRAMYSWVWQPDAPVKPVKVNGRWAWPVTEIRRALGLPEPEVAHG